MSYNDSISMVFNKRSIIAYSLILKEHFQDGGQDGRHKSNSNVSVLLLNIKGEKVFMQ